MSTKLLLTLATSAVIAATASAQFTGPAVVLPTAQPAAPTQPTTTTSGGNGALQVLDPFHVSAPIIAAPHQFNAQSVSCTGDLTPCMIGGTWICISDLMVCGASGSIICPREIPNQCRLASGEILCYNSDVLTCTKDGELIQNPNGPVSNTLTVDPINTIGGVNGNAVLINPNLNHLIDPNPNAVNSNPAVLTNPTNVNNGSVPRNTGIVPPNVNTINNNNNNFAGAFNNGGFNPTGINPANPPGFTNPPNPPVNAGPNTNTNFNNNPGFVNTGVAGGLPINNNNNIVNSFAPVAR